MRLLLLLSALLSALTGVAGGRASAQPVAASIAASVAAVPVVALRTAPAGVFATAGWTRPAVLPLPPSLRVVSDHPLYATRRRE